MKDLLRMDLDEVKQNYTMARETALLGQYDTAVIFYQVYPYTLLFLQHHASVF